ncbi:MAG: class II fructose-bisphosphate aldolase [Syntrophales bacterium]
MIFQKSDQLLKSLEGVLAIQDHNVRVTDRDRLRNQAIDDLVYSAVFSVDPEVKEAARWLIRRAGADLGIISSSIHDLYDAMGRKKVTGFTVPAINLRGITYFSAQAVFRAALRGNAGPFIFEIARSEIGYTEQRPAEYTAAVTAAAIKTGYSGPLFLQGDHFQVSARKFANDPAAEVDTVRALILEAVEGGFYNIDIDSSTVVDLSKPTVSEQQKNNYTIAADLTAVIRKIQPPGITISVGGEIGEVGKKNSTIEELRAFMEGYRKILDKHGKGLPGISKISVQTGTTHGGVPLPDGSIAKVKLDFDTLQKLSEAARSEFGLAGAVQHGASTLPNEAFDKFPRAGTAEIHLATGFQNLIYDSRAFPKDLREKVYSYIRTHMADEKSPNDTEEQFIYKTRKKGFGPFKKQMWELPPGILNEIGRELEEQFYFLFEKLNVVNNRKIVDRYIKPVDVSLEPPSLLTGSRRAAAPTDRVEEYGEGE